MSFSSFKNSKLIFENFRKFINEQDETSAIEKVANKLADPGTPLSQYVAILKKYAKDPSFRALASAGQTDGDPEDERVKVTRGAVAAKSLTATQAEIGFGNSLDDQLTNAFGSTEAALGLKGDPIVMGSKEGPVPLLVWNNKYVLDGHHRWSQIMMTNPEGSVVVDSISGPAIDNEEEALKAMQLAIASAAGNVETKPFKGENLMQASPQQVAQHALANITEEVLQLLVKAGKIEKPDKKLAARYFANNVPVIKKSQGRFSREKSMPQAGKSGVAQDAVNKALGTGKINFQSPKPTDIKK